MYTAELTNRFLFNGSVEYDCVAIDDEGIMPERRDHISIPEERDVERFLRSIKNSKCAHWEEEYLTSLPIEQL